MPSKELLSAVLGYVPFEIKGISSVGGVGKKTLVVLNEDATVRAYINIYELMHLMKEWAWINGYYYWYENSQIHIKELYYSPKVHIDFESKRPFNIDIDTKACEYILEQTNEPK